MKLNSGLYYTLLFRLSGMICRLFRNDCLPTNIHAGSEVRYKTTEGNMNKERGLAPSPEKQKEKKILQNDPKVLVVLVTLAITYSMFANVKNYI